MSAVAAASLNVHRHDDVRPKRAEEPHVVADDLLAPPLPDHFRGVERVAIVDRPREVLLGAVEPVRRQQLAVRSTAMSREQLRADLVLAAVAAIVLHVDGRSPMP